MVRLCLQWFDSVGWASGRASSLWKLRDEVFVWLSVWSKVQIVCICFSWCHCHPKTPSSLASFKSRLVLPFWYRLTQVVLEKRQLNMCSSGLQCCNWSAVLVMQCGQVQQAIDTCVYLNQWNLAIDLARQHNVRDTEPLLVKYAETLLDKNKTFSAVELFRKANHHVDAAKLLFQVPMLLCITCCLSVCHLSCY